MDFVQWYTVIIFGFSVLGSVILLSVDDRPMGESPSRFASKQILTILINLPLIGRVLGLW
jgi:hypothetical protein